MGKEITQHICYTVTNFSVFVSCILRDLQIIIICPYLSIFFVLNTHSFFIIFFHILYENKHYI